MSKLKHRGIMAEVTEDTYHDEPFLQIMGLTEAEEHRVIAGLLDMGTKELPPGCIHVNSGVMVQLIARFMLDETEAEIERILDR